MAFVAIERQRWCFHFPWSGDGLRKNNHGEEKTTDRYYNHFGVNRLFHDFNLEDRYYRFLLMKFDF